jgi:hypothetical protein
VFFSAEYETSDPDPWAEWGHDIGIEIYNLLIEASNRGVEINVVQNAPGSVDSLRLRDMG